MKQKFRPPLFSAALCVALAFPAAVHAFAKPEIARPPVGAWRTGEPDAAAQAAARFAVENAPQGQNLRLERILSLETQVVAGLNFKFRLSVADGARTRTAAATVWQKPGGQFELTGWEWL
jgi:hypothetical protein